MPLFTVKVALAEPLLRLPVLMVKTPFPLTEFTLSDEPDVMVTGEMVVVKVLPASVKLAVPVVTEVLRVVTGRLKVMGRFVTVPLPLVPE